MPVIRTEKRHLNVPKTCGQCRFLTTVDLFHPVIGKTTKRYRCGHTETGISQDSQGRMTGVMPSQQPDPDYCPIILGYEGQEKAPVFTMGNVRLPNAQNKIIRDLVEKSEKGKL